MKILDYLKEVKDKSLKALPFNEVDALCFAQSSYTLIDDYINDKDILTLQTVGKLYFIKHTDKDINKSKSFVKEAPYVTKALGDSLRFKDARFHDFVSIFNKKDIEQFCAFQVDITDELTLVVFRGTDDTLIGWREDFEMAYSVVSAQKRAEEYVNTKLNLSKKYIFLGHSKGGNLAYYAALHADKKMRKNIKKIYSFDGPGINDAFYDEGICKELMNRYEKYIPEFDIFGTIFDDGKACKIIKSDAFAILQHDAMCWLIEDNHFVYASKTTKEANLVKEGLANFIESVSIEQRRVFFEELFVALNELNLTNISDISKAGLPALIRTVKKIMEIDDNSKKTGIKLIKIFTDLASSVINDTIVETTAVISNKVEESANVIKEFVDDKVDYHAISETINDARKKVTNIIEKDVTDIKELVNDRLDSLKGKL